MARYEIPPEVLRDLIFNIDGEISAACPFAFLLVNESKTTLDSHIPILEQKGLLDSPPEQDGLLAIRPSLRRTLDVLARPIRRVVVSEVRDEHATRAVYVSDGIDTVIAMFDRENCVISDPLDLEAFRDALVAAVGPPKKRKTWPTPYQIHPAVLAFIGAIVGPWNNDNLASFNKPLQWPVSRSDGEARLTELLNDADSAGQLIDSMVEDKILAIEGDRLDIHPNFRTWHEAISSADVLEIQRLEYPESDLERVQVPIRGYFLGSKNERCLIWPMDGDSEEVLLSRPTEDELRGLVGYLVGWLDPE